MTSVSIIMSVTNRPKNLRNTLRAWSNIDYLEFDFVLIDNDSGNPEILKIADEFKECLHMTTYKEPTALNLNVIWNKYGKQSKGEYVIFAMMDEIVSHKDVIQKMLEFKNNRASLFVYFMSEAETNQLDNLQWQGDPTTIPNGYSETISAGLWSHITGAYREHWDWFGWFRNEDVGHLWVEQDVHLRERCLERGCETPKGVYCLHQSHPPTPFKDWTRPGYSYKNEMQARLLEPAERDVT